MSLCRCCDIVTLCCCWRWVVIVSLCRCDVMSLCHCCIVVSCRRVVVPLCRYVIIVSLYRHIVVMPLCRWVISLCRRCVVVVSLCRCCDIVTLCRCFSYFKWNIMRFIIFRKHRWRVVWRVAMMGRDFLASVVLINIYKENCLLWLIDNSLKPSSNRVT